MLNFECCTRSARASSGGGACSLQLGENVVAFLDNEQVPAGSEVRLGATVTQRCQDIGKFKFFGSVRRTCTGGTFDTAAPECLGLNQHFDYSVTKPPTILFRYEGSITQTNDGRLMVFPGTTLHMECLFQKMHGTPSWVFPTTTTRSHLQVETDQTGNISPRQTCSSHILEFGLSLTFVLSA